MGGNQQTTYIFLGDQVHSPTEIKNTFGEEVIVTKKDRSEIWFDFANREGQKGYVVYPELFAENTAENRKMVETFKEKMEESRKAHNEAMKVISEIQIADIK